MLLTVSGIVSPADVQRVRRFRRNFKTASAGGGLDRPEMAEVKDSNRWVVGATKQPYSTRRNH